jgi:hypothetical protein
MAVATVIAKTRIWYPGEVEVFNNPTIDRLQSLGYQVYAITVEGISNGSATSLAFDDATTILDGSATPDAMWIESADALDDTGATDCVQEVIINMVNINGDPYRKTVATTGVTGTLIDEEAVRIYSFYGTSWGSGDAGSHQAENTITLGDDVGPSAVFVTIPLDGNESDGARIWVPEGYKSIIERVNITSLDTAMGINDGCTVQIDKVSFEHVNNTAGITANTISITSLGGNHVDIKPQDYSDTGTTQAYYLLKEAIITTATLHKIYIMFILYKSARDGV